MTASPKQNLVRSEKYRRHIASLPCVVCGRDDVQAAHFRMNQGSGFGRKPGDDLCSPLCVADHREQGEIGEARFWRRFLANADNETLADVISSWRKWKYAEWKDASEN